MLLPFSSRERNSCGSNIFVTLRFATADPFLLAFQYGFLLDYKLFRIAPLRGAGLSNFEATRITPRWGKKVTSKVLNSCRKMMVRLNEL